MNNLVTVLLFLLYFGLNAQNPVTIAIAKSDQLIQQKQYLDAYNILNSFPKEVRDTRLIFAKNHLVTNYYVTNIMYQAFSLKNLKQGEVLKDLRSINSESILVDFNPKEALENLLEFKPENKGIHAELAQYYFDAHNLYGDQWIMPLAEQFEKIKYHNEQLLGSFFEDADTHYALAYYQLSHGEISDAIKHFKNCLALDSLYAEAYYNMAYAYLYIDERDSCLVHAEKAFSLYNLPNLKADAARMIAVVYDELDNRSAAKENYEMACYLQPDNYFNVGPLLDIYVRDSLPKSDSLRLMFYNIAPSEPTIYNDLGDIYNYYNMAAELTAFYEHQLSLQSDTLIQANLHFYLAQQYLKTDLKMAAKAFNKANNLFAQTFESEHPVFKVIEDALKMTVIIEDKP